MTRVDPIIEPSQGADHLEALDPEVRMRLEHAGKWVAWSPDGRRIVAAGDGPEQARSAAERAGFAGTILDWIPPIEGRPGDV